MSDADNHWHECECGDKSDIAVHTASDWIIDTAATETENGAKHKECTVCHKVLEAETIPATGSGHTHTYGEAWMFDDTHHWKACTDTACTNLTDSVKDKAAHTASDWIIDYMATKTMNGAMHKECTVCHKVLEATVIPAMGDFSGGVVSTSYAITVKDAKNGDVTADRRSASAGTTVTITVKPDSGYVLGGLTVTDDNGQAVRLTDMGSGRFTFTMPASKVAVETGFSKIKVENPFVDVKPGSYYEDAVIWAVGEGITGGTSATTFDPNATCNRAQAVTFLWRAAGSPAPRNTAMPFTDVPVGSYYYDAVLWAVENGVTNGTSATTFSPRESCNRAQIVTFLWRAQKSPAASAANPFADVAADAYYTNAVLWAVKEGVTAGTTAVTFSPRADCTRAQIVTFIYRALAD